MEHLHDLSELKLESSDLTIGSFDGVHRGHQHLIQAMVASSQASGCPSVVLTFFPHPSVVLRGRKPSFYINTPDEKAELLGKLGIDYVLTQPFDLDLSRVTAGEFLDRLHLNLGMRSLWVGADFALGHNREGDRNFLQAAAVERDFELRIIEPLKIDGEVVSSTRVREALRSGSVSKVEAYLGRPFMLPGQIVRGVGRGRRLGIPTANLKIWDERAYPRTGVYACMAAWEGGGAQAVTNIGHRPTFEQDGGPPTIEAHLLDFEGDLYEREIKLTFYERLRHEQRFSSPQALLKQIQRDIQEARIILAARSAIDHA
jgi:riboflavin kinase/FMN adenylyltransferase